ncbi:hypothetical protein KYK29_08080 [Shinella daejeonensis]|uniref:hypothetical protein n=1 Tax=Shinella daejeonensis TaxID=659017 RepID=UPI0020C829EB|nr:hypothetical protein [Shinella daejeonensis]MCP8894885.1 hypothetical protein [Shinella daejeonensis]
MITKIAATFYFLSDRGETAGKDDERLLTDRKEAFGTGRFDFAKAETHPARGDRRYA